MGDNNDATRDVADGDTRNSQNTVYTIYLQAMYPLMPVARDAKIVADGVIKWLQKHFDDVCKQATPAAPKSVKVKWVGDIRNETLKNNEMACYFVKKFGEGMVREKLTELINNKEYPEEYRDSIKSLRDHHDSNQGTMSAEGGLTVVVGDLAVSEVHVETAHSTAKVFKEGETDVKPTEYENYDDGLENWMGRFMANVAFHELLHNKVEFHERGGEEQNVDWELHDHGGGSLADGKTKPWSTTSETNLKLMKKHILTKGPRQYSTTTQPPPATTTIGRMASLSQGLGGLNEFLADAATEAEEALGGMFA